MTLELVVSCIALVLSVVAFARSFQPSAKAKQTAAEKKDALGKRYAELAWTYSRVQKDSTDRLKARKHAEQAFILADTAADGKRDFNDAQVSIYLDANYPVDS